jgi:hypothetical protein
MPIADRVGLTQQQHAATKVLQTGGKLCNWVYDLANSPATPDEERSVMRGLRASPALRGGTGEPRAMEHGPLGVSVSTDWPPVLGNQVPVGGYGCTQRTAHPRSLDAPKKGRHGQSNRATRLLELIS